MRKTPSPHPMRATEVVILGGSGDLAKKKLFPALSSIENAGVQLIAYSRSDMQSVFIDHLRKSHKYDDAFLERVKYVRGNYEDLSNIEVSPESLYYVSLPPQLYISVLGLLISKGASRVGVEKPFGRDLAEFLEIKSLIARSTAHVYLIDHYMYKPMTIAMQQILSANNALSTFLCSVNVCCVEAIFKEDTVIGERVSFDAIGIMRDVIQNHLAEVVGVACAKDDADRLHFFRSAQKIDPQKCLFGQYEGYVKEIGRSSQTETACVIPMLFDHERWKGVPFVIRAGKGLDERRCEIRFKIRPGSHKAVIDTVCVFRETEDAWKEEDIVQAWIVFNYGPRNEVFVEVKKRDSMDERLLYTREDINRIVSEMHGGLTDHEIVFDALVNNKPFSCVSAEEVEVLWRVFDPNIRIKDPVVYPQGTSKIDG